MIKTLRITSILAAVLAITTVGFFVFRIVHGVRSDGNIKEFLNSPGVIERFKMAEGNRTKTNSGQISPLVQQAQAFALYLNPPAPKEPKNIQAGMKTGSISSQLNVTPKFKVIGISYYAENPAMSMAFIDEPGKGKHWVKQSTQVGHLLIEDVQNDHVIVKGGTETFKLAPERELPQPKSPVTSSTSISKKPASTVTSRPRPQLPTRTRSPLRRIPSKSPQPEQNEDKSEKLEELYDKLSDKTDSELSEEERAEQIVQLISNIKASYISPEEAKKLEDLGEQLENFGIEPNLADSNDEL